MMCVHRFHALVHKTNTNFIHSTWRTAVYTYQKCVVDGDLMISMDGDLFSAPSPHDVDYSRKIEQN